ncbi:MAG: hypothetical protein J0M24_01770 [Verrucomicrobia bacterium]|nr:hypothetical protein [Verrucomicrobiota bacterium]
MTTNEYVVSVGDVVEVASGRQPLPFGLTPGFQVRVIRRDQGGALVEREGREWRLADCHLQPRRSFRSPQIAPRSPSPSPFAVPRPHDNPRRAALAGRLGGGMTR